MDIATPKIITPAELPSQPAVIEKLNLLIGQDDVGSHRVAKVIETDQGFTARVLRLVNSPFYGFSRKIISVEEAVTMLGLNAIHQLLLATSVIKAFQFDDSVINEHDFWQHSFAVGVIAKHLFVKMDKDSREEVFISGILHDVGRLIFVQTDKNLYRNFRSGEAGITDLEAERKHFGIDHQALGNQLAEKWNFPESIRVAIACHHTPLAAGDYIPFAAAVNIANMISHAMDIGDSGRYYVTEFYPQAWEIINLSMSEFEESLKKALVEIDETRQILSDL